MWQKILDHYLVGKLKSWFLTFSLNGHTYQYFCHRYNAAWRNERTIEVPIIWHEVKTHQDKQILELGNVLAHYYPIKHTVVDKYEKAKGVINQDIIDYTPKSKYDLIVSISTLEHVGYDEPTQDPKKILKTIGILKRFLAKDGKAVMTFPVGYNPFLDQYLQQRKLPFNQLFYLQRTSRQNLWQQLPSRFKKAKYGAPFANANVIAVGVIYK